LNKVLPLVAFTVLLLVPAGAQNALATNVGPNDAVQPPRVDTLTEHTIGISHGWEVGPVEIFHDPNAGPWLKTLREESNTPFPKTLIETILVDPTSKPFSDWHEKIDVDSCYVWSLRTGFFTMDLPLNTKVSVTFSQAQKIVDWTFDPPIPPGHEFKLFKFIDCDTVIGPRTGTIEVLQFPTVPAPDNQIIGGEIIPIEQTSLLLAGAQSFSWMIPVVLSIVGIGLFVASRKSE